MQAVLRPIAQRAATGARAASGGPAPERYKLWKYAQSNNGQVTQSLSPFAQNITASLFHNAPQKILKKVTDNAADVVPAAIFLFGIVAWSDNDFHHRSVAHRD